MSSSPFLRLRALLTLDTVWLLAVPIALFAVLCTQQVAPHDFWWHMRTGQLIVDQRAIPTTDLFTFTRYGQPWTNQAWLMQAAFYLTYQAGGLPLIIFFQALTTTAGYFMLQRAAALPGGLRAAVLATLLATLLGSMNWGVRPQTVSFLAFGLLIWLIESHRAGRTRRLWWVIPLFVVWANSHGAFVFGIAALGLYVAGRLWEFWRAGMPADRRTATIELAVLGLLALLALCLNPEGPVGMIRYVLGFLQSDVTVRQNAEFAPLVIKNRDGLLFFASLLLWAVVLLRSSYRPRADQVLSVLVFAGLALFARRNLAWFGFVLAPLLAAGLAGWWRQPASSYGGKPGLNGLLLAVMLLAALILLPWWRSALPMAPARQAHVTPLTPEAATEYLCETLPDGARVFQYQPFTSYQIWACPRLPVFIDTRIELYPQEQWEDYFNVELGRFNWQDSMDQYGITHLFLSTTMQEWAVKAATADDCWQEIYRDERAVLFQGCGS